MEVLNLISDHENIAELIDSYEDPQHVHLVCSFRASLLDNDSRQVCTCGCSSAHINRTAHVLQPFHNLERQGCSHVFNDNNMQMCVMCVFTRSYSAFLPAHHHQQQEDIFNVVTCRSWSCAEAESYLTELLNREHSQREKQQVSSLPFHGICTAP